MIVDERFVTYINSLDTGNTPFLEEIGENSKQKLMYRLSEGKCRAC